MKELKQLAKLLSRSKLRFPKIVNSANPTKIEKLYDKLRKDKPVNIDDFFPPTNYQDKEFFKLKTSLEERLINSLLFINHQDSSTQKKATAKCYKNLAIINELRTSGLQQTAAKLAKKSFKISVEFDLSILAFQFADYLQYFYANIKADFRKFNHYTNQANFYFSRMQNEKKAERTLNFIFVHSSTKKRIPEQVTIEASRQIQELKKLNPSKQSSRFSLIFFNTQIIIRESQSDHIEVIEACNKALRFFAAKPEVSPISTLIFQIRKLPALITLNQFQEAKNEIQQALKIATPNYYNHYVIQLYKAFLGFHADNETLISDALTALQNVKNENLLEQVKILEAYYAFLIQDTNFNTQKFLQSIPIFSKDKRGNNINILIAQILLLLQSRAFDAAEIRISALQSYAQRNLMKNQDFRSNCFIKLLSTLPQGSFYQKRVEPRAKKYLKKLESLPLEKANQNFELEIIRYEILWKKVFELLD